MRLPETTTVWSGRSRSESIGTTLAWRKAVVRESPRGAASVAGAGPAERAARPRMAAGAAILSRARSLIRISRRSSQD
jgi:hypothetical protein